MKNILACGLQCNCEKVLGDQNKKKICLPTLFVMHFNDWYLCICQGVK